MLCNAIGSLRLYFAREWGESTRIDGGLTSVSAQDSGATAPSQGAWRVPAGGNFTVPSSKNACLSPSIIR